MKLEVAPRDDVVVEPNGWAEARDALLAGENVDYEGVTIEFDESNTVELGPSE